MHRQVRGGMALLKYKDPLQYSSLASWLPHLVASSALSLKKYQINWSMHGMLNILNQLDQARVPWPVIQ